MDNARIRRKITASIENGDLIMISKWIVHPKIAKWGKQTFGKKSPLIASKKFDKMICGADYSKEKDKSVWVVLPLAPPPIDKDLADFIEKMRQKLAKVFLIPKEKE